jgi:hypothetical protein
MLKTLEKQFNKYVSIHKYAIAIYWLFMCMLWFSKKGIIVINEAGKYINESDRLVNGQQISDISYLFYYLPIALIAFSKKIGLGVYGYVALQYIMCAAMVCMLYKIVLRYANTFAAFIASILLITCTQFIEFSSYVQTETPFFAISLFSFYSAQQYLYTKRNKWLMVHFIAIITSVLVRPTGIAVLAAYSLYWLIYFVKQQQKAFGVLLIGISTLLGSLFLYIAINYATMFDFILPFKEGRYICGYQKPQFVPNDIWFPQENKGFINLLLFIIKNPIYFLKSCLYKISVFYGMWRPVYSTIHNVFSIIYFYPVFTAGFIGLYKLSKTSKELARLIFMPVFFTTLIIMFTCDDTNNRFILPLIPLFIIAIFIGFFNKLNTNNI